MMRRRRQADRGEHGDAAEGPPVLARDQSERGPGPKHGDSVEPGAAQEMQLIGQELVHAEAQIRGSRRTSTGVAGGSGTSNPLFTPEQVRAVGAYVEHLLPGKCTTNTSRPGGCRCEQAQHGLPEGHRLPNGHGGQPTPWRYNLTTHHPTSDHKDMEQAGEAAYWKWKCADSYEKWG